jgi:Zn-dependent protease
MHSVPDESLPPGVTNEFQSADDANRTLATAVETELNRPERGKRTSIQGIGLLLLSLLVFAATGLFSASWVSVAILMVVLFIHESGHWLAMKAFGYRDLQMFFIPFFGAAVSGKESTVSTARKAVVALLGPAPGIILGIVSGIIYLKSRQPVFLQFGITSVFINALNLLPIYPLDGGRFLDSVIFCRHPIVDLVFKLLAVFVLAGSALWLKSIPLGVLAFVALAISRETYFQSKIVSRLRLILKGRTVSSTEKIPKEYLETILPELSAGLSRKNVKINTLANRADAVWRRFTQQPPRFWASFALICAYVGIFAFGIVGAVTLVVADNESKEKIILVQQVSKDGKTVLLAQKFWKQTKIFQAQLNDQGLYDGPSKTWSRKGVKRKEGLWENGFSSGEWKNYDINGNLESITTFHNGRPIKYQVMQNGDLVELEATQWPMSVRYGIQNSPMGFHPKPESK